MDEKNRVIGICLALKGVRPAKYLLVTSAISILLGLVATVELMIKK